MTGAEFQDSLINERVSAAEKGARFTKFRASALCGAALAMFLPVAAMGQSAVEADTNPAARTGGLEEIIVTARKKEESIQNIPIAAEVLSAEQVANYKVDSIEAVSTLAPQLIVGRAGAGNGASIGLRGVSVPNTSVSLEQSVATIVDGVYISGGHAINEGLFDIARIEVLKGPQALFYGKNTTAGAISITTADPARTTEGMIRAGYEFNGSAPSIEGNLSLPLSDTLAVRFAGFYSKQFGSLFRNQSVDHIDSTFDIATGQTTQRLVPAEDGDSPGERNIMARTTLLFEPSSDLTARVKFTFTDFHNLSPAANLVTYFCPVGGVAQNDPTLSCGKKFKISQSPMAAAEARTNPLFGRHGGSTYQDYKSYNVSGDLEWKGDAVTLSIVPAYVRWDNWFMGDFDYTSNFLSPGGKGNHSAEHTTLSAFSTEARLQSDFDGPLNFMIGGYFQDQKLDFYQEVLFPGGPSDSSVLDPTAEFVTVRKESFSNGKTYAGFAQLQFDVTDQLNITGGARYTHEKKESEFAQSYVNAAYQAVFLPTSIGAKQSFNNFSPEVTLTYRPSTNVTAYASFRTAYKSGGFDISGLITPGTTPQGASYRPEKVKGFEGGVKSILMDNQLRLNADVFWYTYNDQQINFLDAASLRYFTLNAARLRTRGAELLFEYAPRSASGLTVNGSIAYTDAKYTKFPFAPCFTGQSIAEGCTVGQTDTIVRPYQNLAGQRPAQAPEWTANLQVNKEFEVGNDLLLTLSANGRYSSSYFGNGFVSLSGNEYKQSAFATIDAGVRFGPADKSWQIGLLGKNLTNKFVFTDAQAVPFNGGGEGTLAAAPADVYGAVNDPRTVEAQVTFRF
ncbi:TonB-dependent receptor [Sphingobium sp. DEHP117]|uniref:TonB-dependent receptor n=1 Tax=Sphingobium sp. DEHP117 TaxID=2993436 RepID=UPI0027D5B6BF|nr:TonB-dependent receptor [Sphingobium sp. DEHP117]MDQ4421578.1 TonB-dependent receptor [Sphingobium sp. DEHP117]